MKKIRILLVLIIAALATSSCDNWLNLTPTSGVARDDYWKTKEDVASFTTGLYSGLVGSDVSLKMWLWGEMRADMINTGTWNNSNLTLIKEGEITENNAYCNWASFYTIINDCNTLLKYAPGVKNNDNSFTQTALEEYEAQAVAIRSLMYFYLIRNFGDIPYTTTAYTDDTQNFDIAKSDKDSVLTKVISDMEGWVEKLPTSYSTSTAAYNKGKMTRYAGYALLADMYLWKENYQKTIDYCDKIVSSGQYALIPVAKGTEVVTDEDTQEIDTVTYATTAGAESLYTNLYVNGNSTESIFELQFASDNLNPFYDWFATSPHSYVIPNSDFINDELFPSATVGSSISQDIREKICSANNSVWKYSGLALNDKTVRTSTQMTNHLIVYRLAEIYLMRAEAENQLAASMTGDAQQAEIAEALADVDVVRSRSNAVDATDITRSSQMSVSMVEEFILEEEAREMAFEGKRWYDVLRNAKRNSYAHLHYLTDMCIYSTTSDKVYSLQAKYNNHNSHYLPIYINDMKSNSLLVQNSFYADESTTSK